MNNKIIIYSLLFIISPAISSESQRSQKKAIGAIFSITPEDILKYMQRTGYSGGIYTYTVAAPTQDCLIFRYNTKQKRGVVYNKDTGEILERIRFGHELYASLALWDTYNPLIGTLTPNERHKLNNFLYIAAPQRTFYYIYKISHVEPMKPKELDEAGYLSDSEPEPCISCNHETKLKSDRNFIAAIAIGVSIGGIIVALATLHAVRDIVENFHYKK